MKTRSGFVSNSSSSSFTIIATKAAFDRVRNSVSDNAKMLMDEAWGQSKTFSLDGMELLNLSYVDDDCGFWQSVCENIDSEEAVDEGNNIIDALREDKGVFVHEEYQ